MSVLDKPGNSDDFQKYLDSLIKDGYIHEDLEPIKCEHCDSTDLEDENHIVEELGTHCTTEYDKICKSCGETVGHWAYGYWQP